MKTWTQIFVVTALAASCAVGCNSVTAMGDYKFVEKSADSGSGQACTTSEQCQAVTGEYSICRKSDQTCVNLLSQDCTAVVGEYKNDDAIIFGTIFPTTGSNALIGKASLNAIELAQMDFQRTTNGLPQFPGGKNARPLVLVECTDEGKNDVGKRAAEHLVTNVRVPAILGSTTSGVTSAFSTITIPANVLILSPAITSPAFTTMQDNNLIWRTVSPMSNQNVALAYFNPIVESRVREQLKMASDAPVKVAVVNKDDTWGKASAEELEKNIKINGKAPIDAAGNYMRTTYGDPGAAGYDPGLYAKAANDIVAMKPHIILAFGTTEILANVIDAVELGWPKELDYRPFYLAPWSLYTVGVWDYVKTKKDEDSFRKRFLLVASGSNGDAYKTFRLLYQATVRDGSLSDNFGVSQAYDAMYALAYATYSLGSAEITGPALAVGFGQVTALNEQKVFVGGSNISNICNSLGQGRGVNLEGASGNLDFDLVTGEVKSETQVLCLPRAPGSEVEPLKYTGFYFGYDGTPNGTFDQIAKACYF